MSASYTREHFVSDEISNWSDKDGDVAHEWHNDPSEKKMIFNIASFTNDDNTNEAAASYILNKNSLSALLYNHFAICNEKHT